MKKDLNEFFYPRNFFSLIQVLAFIKGENNKKKKRILFININKNFKNIFDRNIVLFFKEFLLTYFDEIRLIDYHRNISTISSSFFGSRFQRSKIIKDYKKKIKIDQSLEVSTIYGSGDDFEIVLYNILNCKPSFTFLEHGYGNLRDAINSAPNLKLYIYNKIFKILYNLNFTNFLPVNYQSYIGILSKNINNEIYFNSNNVKKKICPKNIKNILEKIKFYLIKKKKVKKFKKNYILLNIGSLTISQNQNELDKLFNKILSLANNKNDYFLMKLHPTFYSKETEKFRLKLKNFLKKNNRHTHILRNGFLSKLPAELLVSLFDIKKIFSDMSSIPFNSSAIDNKLKCYIPLSYALKNTSNKIHITKDINDKNFFYKIGKKILFV